MTGRALYDVGDPDALAHWLAQHPHVVMLAGSSQLDTYLDTGSGALLAPGPDPPDPSPRRRLRRAPARPRYRHHDHGTRR